MFFFSFFFSDHHLYIQIHTTKNIYIYIYVCVYVNMFIYIYILRRG